MSDAGSSLGLENLWVISPTIPYSWQRTPFHPPKMKIWSGIGMLCFELLRIPSPQNENLVRTSDF